MSLNNNNKTNLLFKKFQGVTQGSIVTSDTGGATYSTEPFKSLTGIFQNQIYSEDVPLTLQNTLRQMQNDNNILSSAWNFTTNNARDQTLSITHLQDASGNNLPLAFYKDVYLDKVGANIQAWWLVEPNKTLTTENNVLADTIPWKYNDVVSSTYTPIVTYWKDSNNSWSENAQNDTSLLNWVMDYTSGMLVCYQPESTLQGYTVWSSTTVTEDKKRPRISFIKYTGAKGAAGSGGGSGSGDLKVGDLSGGVYEPTQDVSAIYFDNSQFDVSYVTQGATISLNPNVFNSGVDVSYLFFDVPDSCSNGSGSLVSGSTIEIDLSWNLPPTFKSALPFGPTQTYNSSGVVQTTNIGHLPYFKELKIEYKNWLTNSNPTQGWTDLNMGGSTNQPIIPSSVNSAHVGASSSAGPKLLDAAGQQNSTPFITYQNLSALNVGGQYQFRVYLVNDGIEPGIVDPVYGGIVPYNYHYIPDVSGGFISLGQPGGPTSPTSISFQFTNLFNSFSLPALTGNAIIGYNDDISGADVSLNIPFSGTGPNQTIPSNYGVNLQFHYQVDASSISNPIQMPESRTGYDASMSAIFSAPSTPGFSNTITTTGNDLTTTGIEWYPEYNYVITDFSMESFNVNGSLGVAAAQPSAYGTDSSFVSIIPNRAQAGAETNRIASSSVSITPQTSISTYSAYPFDPSFGTTLINNIYFITDASSIDFNMNVINTKGANNLDPNDSTAYRGIDSSGVDLTRFKMEAIDGSTNNVRYQSTSTTFTGYLDISAVDISDVRFGLFAESTEGSSNSKAQGYYTDVRVIQNAEIRDVSLGAYPDICNNNYEPYTFKITDNYLDAGGSRQDGNTIETTLNIARKPLQDIAYGLAGLQPGSVTLNHSFFGLKMPELGAPAIDVDYSYNLTGIDPYWRPSFTISEDDLYYDPTGSNVLVSSSVVPWDDSNM